MEFVKVRTCLGPSKFYQVAKDGTIRVEEAEVDIPSRIKGSKKKVYKNKVQGDIVECGTEKGICLVSMTSLY